MREQTSSGGRFPFKAVALILGVLVVAGLMLAALNLLICMGYLFISLALREPAM